MKMIGVEFVPFGPDPDNESCQRCPYREMEPPTSCHGCVYVKITPSKHDKLVYVIPFKCPHCGKEVTE